MNRSTVSRGRRWGWIGGFLGAGCWIPVLAGMLLYWGDALGGLLCLLCFGLTLGALWRFLPWRQPQTRIWKLYLASLAPIVLAVAVLAWRLGSMEPGVPVRFWLQLLFLLPVMALPALTMGRRSWEELVPEEPSRL